MGYHFAEMCGVWQPYALQVFLASGLQYLAIGAHCWGMACTAAESRRDLGLQTEFFPSDRWPNTISSLLASEEERY
jgi:hypothetical protein